MHNWLRASAHGRARRRIAGLALAVALVGTLTAGCGGGDSGDHTGGGTTGETTADAGTPKRGNKLIYGLEAESSGGWCLQESQLAIAGIQVARTIYDTLTAPNADGDYVPLLAESVTPNATFDEWTVTLRSGIKFHDGTDLTAEVVKNNLDAYRGKYEVRKPLLFVFVYQNVKDVTVVDDLTFTVTTNTTWPAFPAYLYSSGRAGITAQAQLDDTTSCTKKLIGTGPFELTEWKVNEKLVVVRNPDYWQMGADGKPLPYLDEIEYRPITEGEQRVNALEGGQINAMHTSGALQIDALRGLSEGGKITLIESDDYAEVGYIMLNAEKPPFDNILARQAVAYALDRETLTQIGAKGILPIANGPFAPGGMGYVEDSGFPEYDLDKAKELVAQYEEETGQPLKFDYSATPGPSSINSVQQDIAMLEKAGMEVGIRTTEQAQLISQAIGGDFQVLGWRNHPGGDPDEQYIWWHTGSPVNFGRIDDPEIDRLLDGGRVETDPAERDQIYQDLNRRFGEQVWNVWSNWTLWAIATAPDVHGVMGPDLPDGSKPFPGLAVGHPVSGIWIG